MAIISSFAGRDFQLQWWKGRGGFIDYSTRQAMKWWHDLQQRVLDWGVAEQRDG